jgi:Na+/proline symporter
LRLIEAHHAGDASAEQQHVDGYRSAQKDVDAARKQAAKLVESSGGPKGFSDTNYIFLSFVTRYLPVGIVGLVIAVIFSATMSASSGEINSLATVSVVDIYQPYIKQSAGDHHYLMASRWATLFWGMYAVGFAQFASRLGSLIVAVNTVGSLFYGSLLGCFVIAFGFPRVRGTAVFAGMLAGEAAILATVRFTNVSFLWYNVIGCSVVMATALTVTGLTRPSAKRQAG